jgi:4-diphosphocytidyl-2-C-methyl-D-erythritol kinase
MTDRERTPVVRLAPAKLNLTLAVLGRRSDGFHLLHSVMVPLALADRLSLARAAGREDSLHVVLSGVGARGAAGAPGDAAGRALDPAGFASVLRGIAEARRVVGRGADTFPLAARLEKRIPIAAGLAGGSSDAAAAIDSAFEAWSADVSEDDRRSAAAAAGSDVPFFLSGGPALVEGRGERVTPLQSFRGDAPAVLLVTPAAPLSTRDAFAAFDTDPAAAPSNSGSTRLTSEHLATELGTGHAPMRSADLVARAGVLAVANDLAKAADSVLPGLRPLRRALTRLLGVPIGLSGSGPTLWALYPALGGAAQAADHVREEISRGMLDAPGDGPPFVTATTIVAATSSSMPGADATPTSAEAEAATTSPEPRRNP